jgi:Spy/CpxP family protein refolding chaperone
MPDSGKLFDKLQLSADQKKKIQAIRDKYKDKIAQHREAVRQARQELMTMMNGNASDSQLREKNKQVLAQGQQMMELHFDIMLEMRKVLTPAQLKQLSQIMQERRDNAKPGNNPKPGNNNAKPGNKSGNKP